MSTTSLREFATQRRGYAPGPRHHRAVRAHSGRPATTATTASSPARSWPNLFVDNGYLLVVAVGMTFVILTGGIDLSVGSVVGVQHHAAAPTWSRRQGWPPLLVVPLVLVVGGLVRRRDGLR